MLNDVSWASFGFFNNNIFPNRIAKHIYYTTQYRVILRIDRTNVFKEKATFFNEYTHITWYEWSAAIGLLQLIIQ